MTPKRNRRADDPEHDEEGQTEPTLVVSQSRSCDHKGNDNDNDNDNEANNDTSNDNDNDNDNRSHGQRRKMEPFDAVPADAPSFQEAKDRGEDDGRQNFDSSLDNTPGRADRNDDSQNERALVPSQKLFRWTPGKRPRHNSQDGGDGADHEAASKIINSSRSNSAPPPATQPAQEMSIQYYGDHPDDSSNHPSSIGGGRTNGYGRRNRTASEDFHRFMRRRQQAAPSSTRRSELPTFYRPFYTGLFHKDIRTHCYPHGWNKHCWPLLLSFLAVVFTIWASFSCQYFRGADIGFTGGRYGLWTLEDTYGKCTLWSVLFYSYDLGAPLRWSRVFSMCAMVLGLAVMTTMAQAMQCHAVSWAVGLIFTLVFLVSVSTTSTFNIFIVWGLLTYILFVLIVRAAFVHPVARRISRRGCYYICACLVLCHVFCILTLTVLKSDFCTCSSLSPGRLAGRIAEDDDPCDSVCALHTSGYMILVASALWLAAAIMTLRVGVQPNRLYMSRPPEHFAHYSRQSFTTRVRNIRVALTPRASTVGADAEDDDGNLDAVNDDDEDDADIDGVFDGSMSGNDLGDMEPTCNQVAFSASGLSTAEPGTAQTSERDNVGVDPTLEWPPKRTCCQKCCCDFRITPRDNREKLIFWSFRCTLGFIVVLYTILVILMIGSRAENLNAQEAPDTSPYFLTDVVCAYNAEAPRTEPFQSFPSRQSAVEAGYVVAHCGACGDCSNFPDIEAYVETRKTIAKSAKKCGPVNFLGSFGELVDCLQDKIPFSDSCAVCWAENMRNTGRECLFTCIATLFTGFMSHNNVEGAGSEGWLNHCLYCDEKLSGPEFVTCSGVSRRRLGIASEIERNPAEQCRNTEIDWVSVDFDAFEQSAS